MFRLSWVLPWLLTPPKRPSQGCPGPTGYAGSQVAAHQFAASAMVFSLSTGPSPSSLATPSALLPKPRVLPSWTSDPSQGSVPIARSGGASSSVGDSVNRTASLEVSSPLQRSQHKASTFSPEPLAGRRKRPPTPAPSAAGLLHPLRSTLAVSHDLGGLLRSAPCRRLRRHTLLGFAALQGSSRPVEEGAVTSSFFHLMAFSVSPPADSG